MGVLTGASALQSLTGSLQSSLFDWAIRSRISITQLVRVKPFTLTREGRQRAMILGETLVPFVACSFY